MTGAWLLQVLQRKVDVQRKVNERGECNYHERQEDIRLLRLEVKRAKEEVTLKTLECI